MNTYSINFVENLLVETDRFDVRHNEYIHHYFDSFSHAVVWG